MAIETIILCPMKEEYNLIKGVIKDFKINARISHSGVGEVAAASTISAEITNNPGINHVFVVGYAAGSGELQVGDVVVPTSARYGDVFVPGNSMDGVITFNKQYPLVGFDDYQVITTNSFITEGEIELFNLPTSGVLYEMEAAAVAQVCEDYNIPCSVIKIISDVPSHKNHEDFKEFVASKESFAGICAVIETIIKSSRSTY